MDTNCSLFFLGLVAYRIYYMGTLPTPLSCFPWVDLREKLEKRCAGTSSHPSPLMYPPYLYMMVH